MKKKKIIFIYELISISKTVTNLLGQVEVDIIYSMIFLVVLVYTRTRSYSMPNTLILLFTGFIHLF